VRTKAPSRRRRARPLDPQERRALLLKCALRVFARRGLQGASYKEIAREAKVSIPAVFVYFPTRAELLRAVLDEVARFSLDMSRHYHDLREPAPEIVMNHGRAYISSLTTHGDYIRVMLEWSTATRDEVWPLYLQLQERLVEIIAATIQRWREEIGRDLDKRAEDDARLIVATGPMLAQMHYARVPRPKIDQFLNSLVRDTLGDNGPA
jgi:TetR/AcrR family hemagglutinin/protease transcriptional regulator